MRIILVASLLSLLILNGCKEPVSAVRKMTYLSGYPSGSGMAYLDDRLYIMGDDASFLLIMDTAYQTIDTIQYFPSGRERIPKDAKKDPESLALISIKDTAFLLMVGSGSTPLRKVCWLTNTITKQKQEFALDTFYQRLLAAGIKELNIEGATAIPGGILLANRGNKGNPKNHLIFTTSNFWLNQHHADIHLATIGVQNDTTNFQGVSGLDYSSRKDLLYITVSTENTYNAYEDGTVGKSFLWMVKDLTLKRQYAGINPSRVIDLGLLDGGLVNQKIESVAIVANLKDGERIILMADDDKGGSVLFKADILPEQN